MTHRVMVAIPTLGQIHTGTVQCLVALLRTTQAQCQLVTTEGISFIPAARNYLVSIFLASDCEYLFSIDSDLVFPCGDAALLAYYLTVPLEVLPPNLKELATLNSLDALLSHSKQIVGGDYLRKSQIQRDRNQASTVNAYKASPLAETGWDFHLRTELIHCTYLASGFALVHRNVFEQLQQAHPELRYREGNQERWGFYNPFLLGEIYLPEDYAFCQRLHDQNIEMWLDPSLALGHQGNYCYNALSSTLQRLSKVPRRPELCLVTPDWQYPEVWRESLASLLLQPSTILQSVVLWCDPLLVEIFEPEQVLGEFLYFLATDTADTALEVWIDTRPSWELGRLFAEATYWHLPSSQKAYQFLAEQQQNVMIS